MPSESYYSPPPPLPSGVTWTTYTSELYPKFAADLTINTPKNISTNYKLNQNEEPEQVPFFRNIKGPPTLRNRITSYRVTANTA